MRDGRIAELKAKAESEPDNIDAWFKLGKYAADRYIVGVSEEAIAKVLKHRPADPDVLALLGKILNRRRDLDRAKEVYTQALDLAPENLELLTGLGVVFSNNMEHEKGLEWMYKALEIDPGYPWAVHAAKSILDRVGKEKESKSLLERALKENPESPLISILYAIDLKNGGRLEESEEYTERALKNLFQTNIEERTRTIRMLHEIDGNLTLEYGTKALEKDPDNIDVLISVSGQSHRKNPEKTIKNLEDVLSWDSDNIRVKMQLLGVYLQTGHIAEGMRLKEEVTQNKPADKFLSQVDWRFSQVLRVRSLLKKGQIEKAKQNLEKFMSDVPLEDVASIALFALDLRVHGLEEESEKIFAQAKKKAKSNRDQILVLLVENLGDQNYHSIAEALNEYVKIEEPPPLFYAVLGRVQAYLDDSDAQESLEIAANEGTHDSMILLASLLRREGKRGEAESLLNQVLSSTEASPVDRARSLFGLDRRDEAIHLLEDVVEENPEEPIAWPLLALSRKNDGEDAVRTVARKRLKALMQHSDTEGTEDALDLGIPRAHVDRLTEKYMYGDLATELKRNYLRAQIAHLLEKYMTESLE